MKKQKQTLYILIAGFLLIVFMVSVVSANQKMCITKGQQYPVCPNPNKVCNSDKCYFCVNNANCIVYDENCPGEPVCGDTNATIDIEPPVLTVNSPVENQIY